MVMTDDIISEPPVWPVALSVAGSDSGGGAGIQADLRIFAFCRVFGTTAITAATAQNPAGVGAIEAVSPTVVASQMRAVFEAFTVGAVKTGMLFSVEIVQAVVAELRSSRSPLVVDPVMVATSGASLLREDAVAAVAEGLLPMATIITPNLPEAEVLLGRSLIRNDTQLRAAAAELRDRFGTAVALKGGHDGESDGAVDYLCLEDGCWRLRSPRIEAPTTHGTGCCFSAALAAGLARQLDLLEATRRAKALVFGCLRSCVKLGPAAAGMVVPETLEIGQVEVARCD